MKRILYIAPHRKNRSPGQRFRFEQYIEHLEKNGYRITYSNILSAWDDRIFYKKGNYIVKFFILIKSVIIRFFDVIRAPVYDVVYIYREAFMTGNIFFEKLFSFTGAKIIFDFDDAIWQHEISEGNKSLQFFKNPSKTSRIIKTSHRIFAGNKYLAEFAEKYNRDVKIVPTTIDLDYHKRKECKGKRNSLCIGWTGSSTTLKHFEFSIPILKKIKEKYQEKVYFKIITEVSYRFPELDIETIRWHYETEMEDLSEIDIGIMPLPDNEWTRGKCGFKGLQYMALEIPAVMSPVGVNTEIIEDGVNGFLARTPEDWINRMELLIENKELREKIGKKGKETIQQRYSVQSRKNDFYNYINELAIK